jgi:glycosyltransferase involved in cell wall biosynthesis
MTRIEWGPPSDVEALKDEIADLRDQVQYLRATLVRREGWVPFLLGRVRPVKTRVAMALRRVGVRRGSAPSGREVSVRPYQVRPALDGNQRRLRVLHALADVGLGGSVRIIVDLVEHLPHVEHTVITARRPQVEGYSGLDVQQVDHQWSASRIRSVIRATRPDIVHVHFVADDPRVPWGESDWRWYHHVFTAARDEGCRVIENLNIPVPPYTSDVVEAYVHVSDYVARRFGSPSDRNVVIYPGSDTDLFSRPPGVPLADDSVGMVYRLVRDKLDAASIDPLIEVLRRRAGTRACVVGGGDLVPVFRGAAAAARVSEAVEFPGYVPYEALPGWLARMGVFMAPVVRESFGQVVPFAMGMGIPVIGYRVGALPEIMGDDDLLVAPGDSDALARLAVSLLDDRDRRLEIGRRNRVRAVERFSLPAMVSAYSDLYDSVAAKPRSAAG